VNGNPLNGKMVPFYPHDFHIFFSPTSNTAVKWYINNVKIKDSQSSSLKVNFFENVLFGRTTITVKFADNSTTTATFDWGLPSVRVPTLTNATAYFCAREGQYCTCRGFVVYGTGPKMAKHKTSSKSIPCTNSYFGTDPSPGQYKACFCAGNTTLQALAGLPAVEGKMQNYTISYNYDASGKEGANGNAYFPLTNKIIPQNSSNLHTFLADPQYLPGTDKVRFYINKVFVAQEGTTPYDLHTNIFDFRHMLKGPVTELAIVLDKEKTDTLLNATFLYGVTPAPTAMPTRKPTQPPPTPLMAPTSNAGPIGSGYTAIRFRFSQPTYEEWMADKNFYDSQFNDALCKAAGVSAQAQCNNAYVRVDVTRGSTVAVAVYRGSGSGVVGLWSSSIPAVSFPFKYNQLEQSQVTVFQTDRGPPVDDDSIGSDGEEETSPSESSGRLPSWLIPVVISLGSVAVLMVLWYLKTRRRRSYKHVEKDDKGMAISLPTRGRKDEEARLKFAAAAGHSEAYIGNTQAASQQALQGVASGMGSGMGPGIGQGPPLGYGSRVGAPEMGQMPSSGYGATRGVFPSSSGAVMGGPQSTPSTTMHDLPPLPVIPSTRKAAARVSAIARLPDAALPQTMSTY